MRIHTSAHYEDFVKAAKLARVDLVTCEQFGSRSAERAFEVKLEGDSNHRPNGGSSGAGTGYAADWDQWGVALSHIFSIDPNSHCWAYENRDDFNWKTNDRFSEAGIFPEDYHGDHKFEYAGIPRQNKCRKCSAVRNWTI